MKHQYTLSLDDGRSLRRMQSLLAHHAEIMKIINSDSRHSSEGGAAMPYEVKIELKEKWT